MTFAPHVCVACCFFSNSRAQASTPNTTAGRAALRMMGRIKQLSCPKCVVGSGGHSVG